jgi:hypothetical protein
MSKKKKMLYYLKVTNKIRNMKNIPFDVKEHLKDELYKKIYG